MAFVVKPGRFRLVKYAGMLLENSDHRVAIASHLVKNSDAALSGWLWQDYLTLLNSVSDFCKRRSMRFTTAPYFRRHFSHC